MTPRADWRDKAEGIGFHFHTHEDGSAYWDESIAYAFSLAEIENDIETPTAELEQMCLAFVQKAGRDEAVLKRLGIPDYAWPLIAESWERGDRNLYGRFDFAYRGTGPAKLLEYNADTPTSLIETSYFQWMWLEDMIAAGALAEGADQFNSLHDKLVAALKDYDRGRRYRLHLACAGESEEDRETIAYLAECAKQAGQQAHCLAIEDVGLNADGAFVDENDQAIKVLFKLYPWEWMLGEEYGRKIAGSSLRFIEPIWKSLLSTKGLLPYLWEMAPGHPNLLECYFSDDARAGTIGNHHVVKPLLSREGANVEVHDGPASVRTDGPYTGPTIVQALAPLFSAEGCHAVVGSWLVASEPAGLCIREDTSPIIGNRSRFVPHYIES